MERARANLDITVPMGTPTTLAISLYDIVDLALGYIKAHRPASAAAALAPRAATLPRRAA
jgi:hypothetical protein